RRPEAAGRPGRVGGGELRLRVPSGLADPPGHGVIVLELPQVEFPLLLDFGCPLRGTGEVGVDRETGDQPQHKRTTIQGFHGDFPTFWRFARAAAVAIVSRRFGRSRAVVVLRAHAARAGPSRPTPGHPISPPGSLPDGRGPICRPLGSIRTPRRLLLENRPADAPILGEFG